jgi:hypothetical protein
MLKRQRMCTYFASKACQSMPNKPLMLPTFDADDPRHLAWPDQMPRSSDHSPLAKFPDIDKSASKNNLIKDVVTKPRVSCPLPQRTLPSLLIICNQDEIPVELAATSGCRVSVFLEYSSLILAVSIPPCPTNAACAGETQAAGAQRRCAQRNFCGPRAWSRGSFTGLLGVPSLPHVG